MVRRVDCAEPSLAAGLEARRLGIAMAAIIPIIATTMRSSISEKPSWRLFVFISLFVLLKRESVWMFLAPTASSLRCNRAEREVSGWLVTRAVPMAGVSERATNSRDFAVTDIGAASGFGLVTNCGRSSMTDSVKVG